MVLIQHYNAQNTYYITSMANYHISGLRRDKGIPISRVGRQGHWIAEPSAIAALQQFADKCGHTFKEVFTR